MSNHPLKAWTDGFTNSAILNFVSRVTGEDGKLTLAANKMCALVEVLAH